MTPNYKPEFIFSIVKTSEEIECFFCKTMITPVDDEEYFLTILPGKSTLMATHTDCFEQLGWSMMKYYINYIVHPKIKLKN